MGKIQPHQIGIIATLGGIFLIIVIMSIVIFSGDDNQDAAIAREDPFTLLPSVPIEPQEQVVESKLDQIEDQQKEELKAQRKLNAQSGEIDLDIFDSQEQGAKKDNSSNLNDTSTSLPESPELVISAPSTTVAQQEPPKTTTKRTNTNPSSSMVSKPPSRRKAVLEPEPTFDEDLLFASDFSSPSEEGEEESTEELINIPAVIHNQTTVRNGGRVTIRTTEDVYFNDKLIPKNSFLLSTVTYRNGRVGIDLPRMQYEDGSYINADFNVFDENDGRQGLFSQTLMESRSAQNAATDVLDEAANEVNSGIVRGVVKSFGRDKIREPEVTLKRNQKVVISNQL